MAEVFETLLRNYCPRGGRFENKRNTYDTIVVYLVSLLKPHRTHCHNDIPSRRMITLALYVYFQK